jgi:CheY-like chemotaxis protein
MTTSQNPKVPVDAPPQPSNIKSPKLILPDHARPKNGSLQPTVLIADDNEDTRQMLTALLASKGYQILEAADGDEAVHLTASNLPGLVLLDLQLPRLNGLSVIRRLRKELHLTDVPLVVITGYDKHFDTAVAAGCDDYLVKPIDFERLDVILDYYVPIKARAFPA